MNIIKKVKFNETIAEIDGNTKIVWDESFLSKRNVKAFNFKEVYKRNGANGNYALLYTGKLRQAETGKVVYVQENNSDTFVKGVVVSSKLR